MPYFMQQSIHAEKQVLTSNTGTILNQISSQSEPNVSNTTKLHARIYKRDIAMTDYINIPQFRYLDNFKNPCFKVYANETSDKVEIKCMPYFMIGGFPKTGTTDLYKRMIRHPHINGPAKGKEPLWWSICRGAGSGRKPLSAYLKDIGKVGNMKRSGNATWHPGIVGDFSTREMMEERWSWQDGASTPHMIHRLNPNMRFVVLMREPAARLYSDYVYFSRRYLSKISADNFHIGVSRVVKWWKDCTSKYSIRDCMFGPGPKDLPKVFVASPFYACWKPWIPGNICGYFKTGFYYYIIKEWLNVFPREQFLFLRSEDYAKNPAHVINTIILPFLKIGANSKTEKMFVSGTGAGNKAKSTLIKQGKYTHMHNSTLSLLYDLYMEPTKQLAELLQDDAYLWSDVTKAYV